jgi:putative sigma-54 modulation protein
VLVFSGNNDFSLFLLVFTSIAGGDMQLSLTGRNFDITPGLKSFIKKKLAKIEDLYPRVGKVNIILKVEKYRHTAEIHFRAEKRELGAKKTTKDMYASIEEVLNAVELQASRHKDKLRTQSSRRHSGKTNTIRKGLEPELSSFAEGGAEERPKVIRVKGLSEKNLNVEQAIMELNNSKRDFLVFVNADTQKLNVISRRFDGNFELLEP